jgi:hypothetical protein
MTYVAAVDGERDRLPASEFDRSLKGAIEKLDGSDRRSSRSRRSK